MAVDSPTRRLAKGLRTLGVVLSVLIPVALLASTALKDVAGGGSEQRLGCRINPTRLVSAIPDQGANCPLRAFDRVVMVMTADGAHYVSSIRDLNEAVQEASGSIAIAVARAEGQEWIEVPVLRDSPLQAAGRLLSAVLVTGILLGLSVLIFANSSSAASLPLLYVFSIMSVIAIDLLTGEASPLGFQFTITAAGFLPAALAHLALTYPKERKIVRRAPEVIWLFYGVSAWLVIVALFNTGRAPELTTLISKLIITLCFAAWLMLVIECIMAVRDSNSALERARARVLVYGSLAIPAVPIGLVIGFEDGIPGGARPFAAACVALVPLPTAYAIARYQLFDVGLHVRRAVAYLVYVVVSAAILTGLGLSAQAVAGDTLGLPLAPQLFAIAFVCFVVTDQLRAPLRFLSRIWIAPLASRLSRVSEEHLHQIAAVGEADECARILCGSVREGLEAYGASVFLPGEFGWRLAYAEGQDVPVQAIAATLAERTLERASLLYLAQEEELAEPEHAALRAQGVQLVVALRSGNRLLGILLVTGSYSGQPYSSEHCGFVRTLSAQAAVGIQKANLTRDLLASERFATAGRLGVTLAHELGKPLGVMERLAVRLPERLQNSERVRRDANMIADLAREVRSVLRGVLGTDNRAAAGEPDRRCRLDEVVDRAVHAVSRIHGVGRVAMRLPPGAPELAGSGDSLVRVLVNLLENALLASAADDVVEVVAKSDGTEVVIDVVDRGCGMSDAVRERAFDPFFTTRAAGAGSGLGLAISRDLVEGLGGSLSVASDAGYGTRATVRLPLPAASPS
ncbi:MAG: HAMP domain-containing histidine kinase [Proteobacteria bacterium]|nr:HAMP domain-containing histidine kinase [Pseudomonadota bacterium]